MTKSNLNTSIVIPAYNEEEHIGACLRAIAGLKTKPFEVIVVDNLSTDRTVEVVEQFPFARVVKAERKGVVYARDCGFNAARGHIIGRIDADTMLPPEWLDNLNRIFTDRSIRAVSGSLHFYDIGLSQIIDRIELYWRKWMALRMGRTNTVFLLGTNMAIRRSAWVKVRNQVCHKSGIHEDLDLALHLAKIKQNVVFDASLVANVSARRIDSKFIDLAVYAFINPITYLKHNAKEHRYMYPLIAVVLVNYFILRLLFRAFDKQSRRLSLKFLLTSQSAARPNPAEF